jgi:Methyltransferase domain
LSKKYIERVEKALDAANTGTSTTLTDAEFALEGMSSRKNRILLSELVKDGDRYLEIGVWQGSTFVAALHNKKPAYAVAIDNFSQFDPNHTNNETFKRVTLERGIVDFVLLNADSFNIPQNLESYVLGKKFNVYFYDGAHTEQDQYAALVYYYLTLADTFIYIVDDWNWEPSRAGTRRAIADLGLKIHKEWELFNEGGGNKEAWWNGLYIAVCEKTK